LEFEIWLIYVYELSVESVIGVLAAPSLDMLPTHGVGISSMWAVLVVINLHTWSWIFRRMVKDQAPLTGCVVGLGRLSAHVGHGLVCHTWRWIFRLVYGRAVVPRLDSSSLDAG
jgi:hypothetical protein